MEYGNKILIPERDVIHLINYKDVLYCKSDNNYTYVNLVDGRKFLLVKSLAKFERELDLPQFIRVNQSYLINKEFIINIDKRRKLLSLINEQSVPFTLSLKRLIHLLAKQTC